MGTLYVGLWWMLHGRPQRGSGFARGRRWWLQSQSGARARDEHGLYSISLALHWWLRWRILLYRYTHLFPLLCRPWSSRLPPCLPRLILFLLPPQLLLALASLGPDVPGQDHWVEVRVFLVNFVNGLAKVTDEGCLAIN